MTHRQGHMDEAKRTRGGEGEAGRRTREWGPGTGDGRRGTGDRIREAEDKAQGTGGRGQGTTDGEPEAGVRRKAAAVRDVSTAHPLQIPPSPPCEVDGTGGRQHIPPDPPDQS